MSLKQSELWMKKPKKKWRSYYRLIAKINYPYLRMHNGLLLYIIKYIKPIRIFVAIDDTFIFRSRKKKVPNGHLDYDHANKPNRSEYVWGQNLVAIIFTLQYGVNKFIKLPFRIKLKAEMMSKIHYGQYMMKAAIALLSKANLLAKTVISFDSWFANHKMISKFASSVTVVTQAKLNYVFHHLPQPQSECGKKKKGAPAKYGKKIVTPTAEELKLKQKVSLTLYSQEMDIFYDEYIAKARFLKGMIVKIVYVLFPNAKKPKVLLSTDINLTAVEIIEIYEKRWNIESFFNECKNTLGFKDMIQHSVRTYYRWAYIRLMSYSIINFFQMSYENNIRSFILFHNPWRATNKNAIVPISFAMAQLYFFALFSSFDKTILFHETINNSKRFLKKNGKALNNKECKYDEYVDFLLESG